MSKKLKKPATQINHDGELYYEHQGAIVPPIFQNSLFAYEDWDAIDHAFDRREEAFIYSRGNNPTVTVYEQKIAALAGGEKARLFGSGMGAISAAILHCVKAGSHILTGHQIYGPANNFMQTYLQEKCGVTITYVENDIEAFAEAIQENTTLFYLESPGSLTFSIQDIQGLAKLARSRGIKTIIDNTWATPIFQQPLKMGVDLEVHSCSKYLGGHSDIVGGVLIGNKADLDSIHNREQAWLGAKAAPFEAWLLLRSLRTLPIRMAHLQQQGLAIAHFLEAHPAVKKVYHPGLPSFPDYELGKTQLSGYSSLLSFELATDKVDEIKAFVNRLELFKLGVSWGGHESLVYPPLISYLKEQTPEKIAEMGIQLGLIRISVGLEDVKDLQTDLEQALATINLS